MHSFSETLLLNLCVRVIFFKNFFVSFRTFIIRIRVHDAHKIVSRRQITRQFLSIKLITISPSLLVYFKLCTMTNPITIRYFAPIMINNTKFLNNQDHLSSQFHRPLSSNTNVTQPTSIKATNSILISLFSYIVQNHPLSPIPPFLEVEGMRQKFSKQTHQPKNCIIVLYLRYSVLVIVYYKETK